jgi:hypothetical protein
MKPESTVHNSDVESRVISNPQRFGRDLRRRLESRAGKNTMMRRILDSLTDEELCHKWLQNHQAGVSHAERKARRNA